MTQAPEGEDRNGGPKTGYGKEDMDVYNVWEVTKQEGAKDGGEV